jgi:hypothetical protein
VADRVAHIPAVFLPVLFLLCVILSGCGIIGTAVDKNLNSVANTESGAPFADFKKKHGDAFVADLHADTLLWPREMFPLKGPEANKGYDTGHVDYPRLINGGVDLQMLTVVTKYPLTTTSIEDNPIYDPDAINLVGLLSVAQMWPPATWFDLNERALYQAGRLRKSVNAANGQLVMIETAQELINFHKDNQKHPDRIAVMLGIEGAHALEIGIPPEGPNAHEMCCSAERGRVEWFARLVERKRHVVDARRSQPGCRGSLGQSETT